MPRVGQPTDYQIRPTNKEPEWSNICNNVFDQYLDNDDLFGFEVGHYQRSSSDESVNFFDFSTESEQSHQTSGTSPLDSWECDVSQRGGATVSRQPKAKESVDFWTKTLRALEQNAAESENKQHTLKTAKSHPDFLSLGGCPSPPAIPSSPTDQSFSVPRRRGRGAANGRKASQARSVSRGRPKGITKSTQAAIVDPYATVRKYSASPPKMMTPSRYRAGFKDVWAERIEASPKKYRLQVPPHVLPESPPPSDSLSQGDKFAAFGSPSSSYPALSTFDDQISPLTNTFQQAHIHTPTASPYINAAAHANNGLLEPLPLLGATPHAFQTVPLNDTAPLFPDGTSSFDTKIQAFDFGFSSSPDVGAWNTASFTGPVNAHYTTDQYPADDPFAAIDLGGVLPSIERPHGLPSAAGLGIDCDPTHVSNFSRPPHTAPLPAPMYHHGVPPSPYYIPPQGHQTTPNTPHRRSASRPRSVSPSPPAPGSRGPRATSRSRRASRHRRAKSTTSTAPRHSQTTEKSFVNYTPQDSNTILSGVAPSGSSKTKARREREAADKRRRFSQAAVKAVVEAGGDLDALSKAGLL